MTFLAGELKSTKNFKAILLYVSMFETLFSTKILQKHQQHIL